MVSFRRIASLSLCTILLCAYARTQTLQLQRPTGIAYDATGNLYIVDTNRSQVVEATLAGTLVVVAGTGTQGFTGDKGPATAAELNAPQGIAIGPDGTLYIADTANQRIRAISAGQITTLAGTGTSGFSGDGGAPSAAAFRSPTALAVDPAGALLICDTGNHRIRRVANGVVTTVAGNGIQGFSGDGGPAPAAELDTPLGIVSFAAGGLYVADAQNNRIRSVGLDGIIHTLAGTGVSSFSGDGGPATQAKLALPNGLVLTSTGLLFADASNQRLRLIDNSGRIVTVAGSGVEGKAAEGDAPLGAAIDTPHGVALSPFGQITFADSANHVVRSIANNQLISPAAFAPARSSILTASSTASEVYGAASLNLNVVGVVAAPQGMVQLTEAHSVLADASLVAGTATVLLPNLSAGQHNLTATYLGDGLNPATTVTANLNVAQASSSTVAIVPAQNVYAGVPITLIAHVSSTTRDLPTGSVRFLEGTNVAAVGRLAAGTASASYLSPTVGSHVLQAIYDGDNNFETSSSVPASVILQPMPDFRLSSSTPSQTVQGGSIATYSISVAAQPTSFSGAVVLSATGLPNGASASFSPVQVVPGAGTETVFMNVTTPVTVVQYTPGWLGYPTQGTLLLSAFICAGRRRRKYLSVVFGTCLSFLLIAAVGCGSRTIGSTPAPTATYAITVTGTSTNLVGTVVTHATVVQLTVR